MRLVCYCEVGLIKLNGKLSHQVWMGAADNSRCIEEAGGSLGQASLGFAYSSVIRFGGYQFCIRLVFPVEEMVHKQT